MIEQVEQITTMTVNESQNTITRFQRFDPGDILGPDTPEGDVEMMEVEESIEPSRDRLIVAVDFGTTFSSVACSRFSDEIDRKLLGMQDVSCIKNYPDDRPPPGLAFAWEPREDVPTELLYNLPQPRKQRDLGRKTNRSSEQVVDDDDDESVASDSSSDISIPAFASGGQAETDRNGLERDVGLNRMFWGFGVQKQLKQVDIPKDGTRRLMRFKLMLDPNNPKTQDVRTDLAPILKKLRRWKLITQDTEVITEYLKQLFKHTKSELLRANLYRNGMPIEPVLCVPAKWPSKACRVMQAAMTEAVRTSGLGELTNNSLNDLFIVSEPEAAAASVLAEDNDDFMVS